MGILVIFILIMMFFLPSALKKMVHWKLIVPFFFISCLAISNIGVFDQYSFVDPDLYFHKSLVDKLLDKQLFINDEAIKFYSEIYPKGYQYLLCFLSNFNLSIPQISKLLGIILSSIIPFLFYFLGKEIYQDRKLAFFSGLFCVVVPIWEFIYAGLPRSIAFVLFICLLIYLFKYLNSQGKISFIILLNIIMALILFVHPYTFIIAWFISIIFFSLVVFGKRGKNRKVHISALLIFGLYLVLFFIFKQKGTLTLSTWDFFHSHNDIYWERVPYAFVNFFNLVKEIGVLPILMFILMLIKYYIRPEKMVKYPGLTILICCTFFLMALLVIVVNVNGLFFLRAHRFPPFISSLLYLSSLLVLKDLWAKFSSNKISAPLFCLILLSPGMEHLAKELQYRKFPYDLKVGVGTHKETQNTQVTFNEILKLADYVDKNIPKNEIIACTFDKGDILRMLSRRAVTASWRIGGMITVYKEPLYIFKEQKTNSKMLYDNPAYLYDKYGARFFLFEKDRRTDMAVLGPEFHLIWESENLYFYEIRSL
ncbi:MAG: glycosyltransferase family 39 protein [Candidatus Omnitrophica bacterium]|nr:glycosyltransferase family 39 protein [Candidatus Omnitrophota bacterium]